LCGQCLHKTFFNFIAGHRAAVAVTGIKKRQTIVE
jgi:hypothetical protein